MKVILLILEIIILSLFKDGHSQESCDLEFNANMSLKFSASSETPGMKLLNVLHVNIVGDCKRECCGNDNCNVAIFHHVLGGANLNYANCFLVQCDNEIGCQAEYRESYYTYDRRANILTTTAPRTVAITPATMPSTTTVTTTTAPATTIDTVKEHEDVLETSSNTDDTTLATATVLTSQIKTNLPKTTTHTLELPKTTSITIQETSLEIDELHPSGDNVEQTMSSNIVEAMSSTEPTTNEENAITNQRTLQTTTPQAKITTSAKQYQTSWNNFTFPIYPNETIKDQENVLAFNNSYGMLISIVIFGFLMVIATAYIWLKNCKEINYKKYHEVTFLLYDDELIHQNA